MITRYIDEYIKLLKPPPLCSVWWCLTRYYPSILFYYWQNIFIPKHKTLRYNTSVYDGMSRNDFVRGNLLTFLSKLGAIKRFKVDDPEVDGRWYFIGSIDDD